MIEQTCIEFHDVGIAATMFGVTRTALDIRTARNDAVVTVFRCDVRRNVLMTGQAQLRLALAVLAVVAVAAFLFDLRMRLRDFAGHQQRL
ncbi:MAG TPA: hypothetical protein VFS47_09075 [Steroidobacteraceae bacterium]|nr:hypothetical protein [Steroidobacteraceae bacterium]